MSDVGGYVLAIGKNGHFVCVHCIDHAQGKVTFPIKVEELKPSMDCYYCKRSLQFSLAKGPPPEEEEGTVDVFT